MAVRFQKPTAAFVAASWAALFIGAIVYLIGLWNAAMQLNEKGYYFTVLMYGLFSAVSLQKTVRDRLEGISVTGIYYGLCWISLLLSVALLPTSRKLAGSPPNSLMVSMVAMARPAPFTRQPMLPSSEM